MLGFGRLLAGQVDFLFRFTQRCGQLPQFIGVIRRHDSLAFLWADPCGRW